MLKIYPISADSKKCNHFNVKVNGEIVEAYSCTVSAMPFNRCWPGYQRPIDQTEEASFIYFDTDKIVDFEIESSKDFSEIQIRPLSENIKPKVDGRIIKFSAGVGQYTVELDGHHNALHIFVNPIKDYGINIEDESVLYFGPGVHRPGHIVLKSGQTIFIDGGAVVYGTVYAEDCENISVVGHGILDTSAFERFEPVPMKFIRCKNIVLDGFVFKDSNEWTLTVINCKNLVVDNTKAIGMWRYNSDGYDICNSSNVVIKNSFIRTFDDSIVFKGLKIKELDSDSENVENHLVENCVVWCDWGRALEIGAETCADEYKNIIYRNCDILHTESVAMDINNGDRADVHDVLYENINIEYSKYWTEGMIQESDEQQYSSGKEPHISRLIYAGIFKCMWSQDEEYGKIHDIKYKNINVYMDDGLKLPPIVLEGFSASNCIDNFSIENFVVNGKKYVDKSEINYTENEFCKNIMLK